MSLFVNTSSLNNHNSDCCALNVSETIEHDCLSVLHKLHDQVNGLQLVQVVVQPLARLFNPASLAALVANIPQTSVDNVANKPTNLSSSSLGGGNQQNANQHMPDGTQHDLDGLSTQTGVSAATSTTAHLFNHASAGHSRSQSFASTAPQPYQVNNNISLMSSTSTYMMSPDTAQALIARLDTDRDVNWLMEIIGYGLSMPFSITGEQDSVKDCCTIYCEWLAAALLPYNENNEDTKYQQLSKLVPVPIRKDPNRYARKMLSHLYNVFLPRQAPILSGSSINQKEHSENLSTAVSRQAVLCHRVLRTIENIAQNQANLMDNQTWDHLLALLLTVNDKLLSAPTEPDDIGTQLHDRILGVLFELMLLASAKSIPNASLWKSFHEMSMNWRHRPALVDHWRRITLLLTKRIVQNPCLLNRSQAGDTLSVSNSEHTQANATRTNAIDSAISQMSYENLSQTWYRFLNLIGNPVGLSDPNAISRTDEFYHYACASDNVLDPRQHPCLNVLPQIFMNSMAGLRDFIDCFLGSYEQVGEEQHVATGDLLTPDRHNRSGRGSIISLSNTSQAASSTNSNQTGILSSSAQQSQQSQHLQSQSNSQPKRSGIKSIAMKSGKVLPFTSSSGSHHSSSPSADSGAQQHQTTEVHPKSSSGLLSSRPQTAQKRPSLSSLSSRQSWCPLQPKFRYALERPKCNSILHIFGDWLFSAALIGSDLNKEVISTTDSSTSDSSHSISSASTTTEVSGLKSYSPSFLRKRPSITSLTSSRQAGKSSKHQDSSAATSERVTLDPPLSADSFESGQAEAMAILCKIFSSKASSEEISPVYLSRFYLCIQHCLTYGSGLDSQERTSQGSIRRQLLSSVLTNCINLLQKDLDGINLLIPSFIKAIEFVFECSEKDLPIQPPPRQHNRSGSVRSGNICPLTTIINQDLRKSSILTLLNLLAYPYHFQDLAIRSCLNDSLPTTTFKSLRPRLLKLLFVALQTETDPINMQLLFGGLSLTIHDLATNVAKSHSKQQDNQSAKGSRQKNDSIHNNNNSLGNESANSSLETANNNNNDNSSSTSFVYNSTCGFLIKSLHVTCHLLINIWKHDTQVSLAALELLTTIARVTTIPGLTDGSSGEFQSRSDLSENNNRVEMTNEYRQTTKWICDYICNQCSRPPPAHSRDMHSTIVAAYQCLSVWFYSHPYLMNDESCVNTVMEVIELGVSGQKSKSTTVNQSTGLTIQSIICKADKIMKPSSMRVREAAESLLNICMVGARNFVESSDNLDLSFDTILDEQLLVEQCASNQLKNQLKQVKNPEKNKFEVHKMFKYYSDEDSVIFALLEGSSQEPTTKDSVICLLRTPFGKHCWKMKFNYYTDKSRDKIIANKTLGLIKRPFQHSSSMSASIESSRMFPFSSGCNKSLYFNNSARYFPETLDKLQPNELDRLVASLDDYMTGKQVKEFKLVSDLDKMGKIFSHQVMAEQKASSECSILIKKTDCEEPQPSGELETARILLTHLGLKSSLNFMSDTDRVSSSFLTDLKSLDHLPIGTCDSVSIFYVRKNRTSAKEILESVRVRHNVSLPFFEWLLELGQPTVVRNHSRWTGKASNSWSNRSTLR